MQPIILINRPLVRDNKEFHVSRRKWQPLNLLYIATELQKNNLPVEIIDARAFDYTAADIRKILLERKPDIVFIASEPYDFYQCPNPSLISFYETILAAKESGAKHIVSMGPQATIFDEYLLTNTNLTHIIKGDDPMTAAKVLEHLAKQENFSYTNVSFKNTAGIHLGITQHLENLDELPVGNYNFLPMEKYSANMDIFADKKFSIMTTSRGCPYQCQYCFKKLIGNKIRQMSLPRIKAELDELIKNQKNEAVYFVDDFFTFNKQRILDFCALIKQENYNFIWGCQTRTDSVDKEMLVAMKEAGCIYISYGIESGNQAVENRSGKNLDLKQAEEIIKLTKNIGLIAHINMMYGFPDETKEEFNQTIDFLICHEDYNLPGAIRFYPGSDYYEKLIPGKTLTEIEKISLDLSLTKLKQKDIDRGLAKLILFKKIKRKEYGLNFFYFLLKYLFPKFTTFLSSSRKRGSPRLRTGNEL